MGPYYNTGPNLGDPERYHNFDNLPNSIASIFLAIIPLELLSLSLVITTAIPTADFFGSKMGLYLDFLLGGWLTEISMGSKGRMKVGGLKDPRYVLMYSIIWGPYFLYPTFPHPTF